MYNKNNTKNAIWIYAVILFTSAFIVLLLTAYSQIKYNKNLENYRNQIDIQGKDNKNYKANLNTTLDENKKLKNDIEDLKKELDNTKKKLATSEENKDKIKNNASHIESKYEVLLRAQLLFESGQVVESANLLKNVIDPSDLEKVGVEFYERLVKKVFKPASEKLYYEGYEKYTKKDYNGAIKAFKESLSYESMEYFSDDCMYLLGYSLYINGNNQDAKDTLDKFVVNFPNSNYVKYAKDIIYKIEK